MKVSEFIEWLEQKDQNLEVCFLAVSEEVCYSYDENGSYSEDKHYLTLGIER